MSWWDRKAPSVSREWLVPLGLMIFFMALYLPGLGSYGLFDPWETHYGEVARTMVETGDYIDPVWGSPWDSGEVKRERAPFYSKPPLTMWMMAIGMQLFGANALGVRLLFPLLGLLALLSVYLTTARVVNRRAGALASLLCGLAPSFGFLSHQAVTDGPLVTVMTIGVMCLAMAISDSRDGEGASAPLRWLVTLVVSGVIFGQLWIITAMDQSPDSIAPILGAEGGALSGVVRSLRELWWVAKGKGWVIATALTPLAVWASVKTLSVSSRRFAYLTLFYVSCGLMVCAKGWLGWAPVGGALVLYLLTSGEWRWLKVAQVRWGLIIVLLTGHIWVLAMLGGHHPGWFNRFIIHDHINRLFSGVHSTDSGAAEYFVQWLGYGLFPIIGLLPVAFGRTLSGLVKVERSAEGSSEASDGRWGDGRDRYELLLFGWLLIGFFLFSKANTKFHHYIFPIIPPCAILIALWLEEAWRGQAWRRGLMCALATLTLLWVGGDLARSSSAPGQGAQHWVNLFTYKYDRAWPTVVDDERRAQLSQEAAEEAWLTGLDLALTEQARATYSPKLAQALKGEAWDQELGDPVRLALALGVLSLLLMGLPWLASARVGVLFLLCSATLTSAFTLHIYLPKIAPYWSQGALWDAYYKDCQPFKPELAGSARQLAFERHLLQTASRVPDQLDRFPSRWCAEPAVAFRMNWRGETFYTANTVVPILYSKDLKTFLKQWEGDFYMFTERKRIKSELNPSLPKELKGRYREIFGGDRHFALFKFERAGRELRKAETKP